MRMHSNDAYTRISKISKITQVNRKGTQNALNVLINLLICVRICKLLVTD